MAIDPDSELNLRMITEREQRRHVFRYARKFDCELCRVGEHSRCVRPCYCAGARHQEVASTLYN